MHTTSISVAETPLVAFCLGHADDALILSHRLSEWSGKAPTLEEDLALSNIALDLIGQARALYSYVGELTGQSEDALAYLRDEHAYRNLLLVEQPNGDFAVTIARQFLFTAYADPFWRAMTRATDATLAAIAEKAEKETAYHLRHASEWLIRLGDGTAESARRARAALARLWPFTGELFDHDTTAGIFTPTGIAIHPDMVRPHWDRTVDDVLRRAMLDRPANGWMQSGGRAGQHSEHFGYLLAELQFLPRSHPGAQW
ncbi:MAG: phenylacetate-CoA oxygenase subunit PaaI [Acetobacteraceae bacterium]|nr:phenylacetate-CoA oxygenase subunit PaaI [Acetobacteraceae bacterium]